MIAHNLHPDLEPTGRWTWPAAIPSSVERRDLASDPSFADLPNRRILVTGSHRSSTTWVATMLTANREVEYINEPLNVSDGPAPMRGVVRHSYQYLCPSTEGPFIEPYRAVLRGGCMAEDCRRYHRHRGWTVIKDPFAVFSIPWFVERLGCQVVAVVRRPEAFVSSIKRLRWDFDHRHLLEQPELMRDRLEPFRADMERAIRDPEDAIFSACLLWRMVYASIKQTEREGHRLHIVRHKDLSLDPMNEFLILHERLGLTITDQTRATIALFSTPLNPKETTVEPPHLVRLDSKANLNNWKKRLTLDEIKRILDLTHDVASRYYADSELAPPAVSECAAA